MESPVQITRLNKIGAHRYDFDFKLALDGESEIEFRANALVKSYSGASTSIAPAGTTGRGTPSLSCPHVSIPACAKLHCRH